MSDFNVLTLRHYRTLSLLLLPWLVALVAASAASVPSVGRADAVPGPAALAMRSAASEQPPAALAVAGWEPGDAALARRSLPSPLDEFLGGRPSSSAGAGDEAGRKKGSASQPGQLHGLRPRSMDDLTLEPVVMVATLDGNVYGLDRQTGRWLWRLGGVDEEQEPIGTDAAESQRACETRGASGEGEGTTRRSTLKSFLSPLVRMSYGPHGSSVDDLFAPEAEAADVKLFVVEPTSQGDIYLFTSPSTNSSPPTTPSTLRRVPLTMSQLVDNSPFAFPGDDRRVFVGKKETRLVQVDVKTGKVGQVYGGGDGGVCWWNDRDRSHRLSPESCEHDATETPEWLLLGRTDYNISIHTRDDGLQQSLSYSTYGPNIIDLDVQALWTHTLDDLYLQAMPEDGSLACFKKGADDPLWVQHLGVPVASVYDVVSYKEPASTGPAQPMLLPQPQPPISSLFSPRLTRGLSELPPASFLGATRHSLYVMSAEKFPLARFAARALAGEPMSKRTRTDGEDRVGDEGGDEEKDTISDAPPDKRGQKPFCTGVDCHVGSYLLGKDDVSTIPSTPQRPGIEGSDPSVLLPENATLPATGSSRRLSWAALSTGNGAFSWLGDIPPTTILIQLLSSLILSILLLCGYVIIIERRRIRKELADKIAAGVIYVPAIKDNDNPRIRARLHRAAAVNSGGMAIDTERAARRSDDSSEEDDDDDEEVGNLLADQEKLAFAKKLTEEAEAAAAIRRAGSRTGSPKELNGDGEDVDAGPSGYPRTRPAHFDHPLSGSSPRTNGSGSGSGSGSGGVPTARESHSAFVPGDDGDTEAEDGAAGPSTTRGGAATGKKKRTRRKGRGKGGKARRPPPDNNVEQEEAPKGTEDEDSTEPEYAGPPVRRVGLGRTRRPARPTSVQASSSLSDSNSSDVKRVVESFRPARQRDPWPTDSAAADNAVGSKSPSPGASEKASGTSMPGPFDETEDLPSAALKISKTVLGYGSHGTVVYKGTFQGRAVAVKRLLRDFVTVAAKEVSLLEMSDNHPNVCRYFYKEETGSFLYIALELCPASLADVVERPQLHQDLNTKMEPKRALQQIASGLRHLHSLSIVHRDIKPQNILVSLDANGRLKMLLSDFGLSKKLDGTGQTSFTQTMNNPGGTVGWRAPEILRGDVKLEEGIVEGPQSEGSPADGMEGDGKKPTEERRRLTRAVDIFALGCLAYYILSNGEHPFGNRYERELNVIANAFTLERLDGHGEEAHEAQHLITSMLAQDPKARPRAGEILAHPYFWTPARRLVFLQDASDRFEIMERTPLHPTLVALEAEAVHVVGPDWHRRLDRVFIDNLGKYRKYQGNSVQDLLRALRNKKHHYQDLPSNVQRHLGPLPDGFLAFFTRRFPRLFLHVHSVVADHLRHENMFRAYFVADGDS